MSIKQAIKFEAPGFRLYIQPELPEIEVEAITISTDQHDPGNIMSDLIIMSLLTSR